MKYTPLFFAIVLAFGFSSCNTDKDPDPTGPNLVFKFKFDPTQERLGSLGTPVGVAAGNAAQSPSFNSISGHYVELIPSTWTALGAGEIVYQGVETTAGGANAVDFSKAKVVGENEVFFSIPLEDLAAGTYEYVRVSVTYQNYDILFNVQGFTQETGTLASFVGFNTYLNSYVIDQETVQVNDDKLQGYWGFETTVDVPFVGPYTTVTEGPLVLNGNETEDVTVVLSVSTNQSFEWTDPDGNGQYDPADGDVPVDMGLRGLKAIVQ